MSDGHECKPTPEPRGQYQFLDRVGQMWCCSCGQVWTYQWEWRGTEPWGMWLRLPFSDEDKARTLEYPKPVSVDD